MDTTAGNLHTPTLDAAHLRRLILDYRHSNGLSQRAFAEHVGIDAANVSKFMRDKIGISAATVVAICNVVDVDPRSLYFDEVDA